MSHHPIEQDLWQPNEDLVRAGASYPGVIYDESQVPDYTLPNVLDDGQGGTITTPEQWEKRRLEILDLFRTYVYGYSPDVPRDMYFKTVSVNSQALDGAATSKLIDIHLGEREDAPVIHLQMFIPNNRTAPAPAFLLICNREKSNIDFTRTIKSEFWPVEELVAKGFAACTYYYEDMVPDRATDYQEAAYKYFNPEHPRTQTSWGALSAWAWGASRCLDYLCTDPDIDSTRCTVTGHSRGGKTALWCAAQDTRWAMVVSSCSGCTGAALSRRCYGETVQVITTAFPFWFCENYQQFRNNEAKLPLDQHWLLALIAPRAVYVHSANDDLWADPRGEWLGLLNAEPVWKLLGSQGLPIHVMPALDQPAWGDKMAYHVRPGGHDNLLVDWMRHADFFTKTY